MVDKTTQETQATETPTKTDEAIVREQVEESLISKPTVEVPEVTQETTSEESEEAPISKEAKELAGDVVPGEEASEIEDKDSEELDEEFDDSEEESEVEKMLKTPKTEEDKSRVQRRIDRLKAELEETKKQLKTQNIKEDTIPDYTDDQLKIALQKAIDDGDSGLIFEIIDYRSQKVKKELVGMYEKEKQTKIENAKRIEGEWKDVVTSYDRYQGPKAQELYPGSSKDLNLRDANSLLYQVAMQLYWSPDQDKAAYYRGQPGGQKLAVSDAMNIILSKKAGRSSSKETKKLKKQLLKEKRKKSVITGSPGEEAKLPSKPLSSQERLDEVIAERKKYKQERE